jgi:nucleotide-binding universal stress UspA family protein
MKILVATDGSKYALHAVRHAIKLVKSSSAKANSVTLISVHDDVGLRHAKAFVGADAVADYLRELSDKELKPAMKVLSTAGIKHDMVIKTGNVSQEIVDFAQKGKFDMIVLGSKGRGGLMDLLIGSVAQRVLTTAQIPVVLVK